MCFLLLVTVSHIQCLKFVRRCLKKLFIFYFLPCKTLGLLDGLSVTMQRPCSLSILFLTFMVTIKLWNFAGCFFYFFSQFSVPEMKIDRCQIKLLFHALQKESLDRLFGNKFPLRPVWHICPVCPVYPVCPVCLKVVSFPDPLAFQVRRRTCLVSRRRRTVFLNFGDILLLSSGTFHLLR